MAEYKRLQNRIAKLTLELEVAQLEARKRAYEAAQTSIYHNRKNADNRSANQALETAGTKLRSLARYLDENHDIAGALLDDLVNRLVGGGIRSLPAVKTAGGELAEGVNEQIADLYDDWSRAPEVTAELPWPEVQRLAARSMLRDGECFVQHIRGGQLDHRTRVPYSQELIESDYCPWDFEQDGFRYGIRRDTWGRAIQYAFYLEHPGDASYVTQTQVKRVTADVISHLKFMKRFRQSRGVPVFANVITRLEDLKDLEESKRIQERLAAAWSAVIRKGDPSGYNGTDTLPDGSRAFELAPGMIFDNLMPGETVETLGANRPGSGLGDWRRDQIRALAAGTMTRYSSVARDFDGSYSSQRQEIVESTQAIQGLFKYFCLTYLDRTHRELIDMAIASSQLQLPRNVDADTLYDVEYQAPAMPWVDPEKEMRAIETALALNLTTERDVIIRRGDDPRRIKEQRQKELAENMEQAQAQLELMPEPEPDEEPDDDEQAA